MRKLLTKNILKNSVHAPTQTSPRIGLIGVIEDRNSSFLTGPSRAPDLIRKYFLESAVNSWSELGIDVHHSIVDFGNVVPVKKHHESIYKAVSPSMEEMQQTHSLTPLTLGGDHSITFSMCKAVRKQVGKPLVIVHFDAHPDIYENFEDNPDSHASPFARILETPDLCEQLISIGIRTLSGEQAMQIKKYGVKMIEAKDFPLKGSDILDILKNYIKSADTPVYISFDIDVIEPGLAPGVSHREPGGLSVRQTIDAIHCIPGRIVGADIVEYNPYKDVDFITASIAAKLMKEIAAKIIISHQK